MSDIPFFPLNSIKNNEIEISPLIEDYIQPSSVDLRVGADFRVFENHKYSHIDPKAQQDDLTSLVTATIEEPFVLHPGEFVLGTLIGSIIGHFIIQIYGAKKSGLNFYFLFPKNI